MEKLLNLYAVVDADFARAKSFEVPSGKELAQVIADGLADQDVQVERVEPVDFCYAVKCDLGGIQVQFEVGEEIPPDESDAWSIQICAPDASKKQVDSAFVEIEKLLMALDHVLKTSERISEVRWYPSFETPGFLALMPALSGPTRSPDYESQLHPLTRYDQWWDRSKVPMYGCLSGLGAVLIGAALKLDFVMQAGTLLFLGAILAMMVVPLCLRIAISQEVASRNSSVHSDS